MKNVLKAALVFTLLLVVTTSHAQKKVAHINMLELIQAMPEAAAANKDLESFRKVLMDELEAMQVDLRKKAVEFDNTRAKMTPAAIDAKTNELNELSQKLQKRSNDAGVEFKKKEEDLFVPITDKAKVAVNKVAKANGIATVLDANALLYADEANGLNLLPLVKKELGITK